MSEKDFRCFLLFGKFIKNRWITFLYAAFWGIILINFQEMDFTESLKR